MHVIIVMGVTGAGKTTVGRLLADQLGWEFIDADELHPEGNRRKMQAGRPLTDDDRRPWLAAVRAVLDRVVGERRHAVVACSALRQAYRDALTIEGNEVGFAYLKGRKDLIAARIAGRVGHFMNPRLLQSQFDTLQEPVDGVAVDVSARPEEIVAEIRRKFDL